MAKPHHPRRGSKGYYPRVRSKGLKSSVRSWPAYSGKPRIQGFAGYKVGMTHVEMVDYRKYSVTSGQNIVSAATVVEVPPVRVLAVRYYAEDYNGRITLGETWAESLPKELSGALPERKKTPSFSSDDPSITEIRLLVCTDPDSLSGIPKKVPDVFEVRVGGSTIKEIDDYCRDNLGKVIPFSEFSSPGRFVDVIGITKGKGFQGHVKRFGIKLLTHKNSKHRRMIGTLGPWHPDWVRNTVPQAGQVGTHQRTAHNIRVLQYGTKDEASSVNVKGGFPGYGIVKNDYILLHGSIPGPSKRLVKFRDTARQLVPDAESMNISYVSLESKQGD